MFERFTDRARQVLVLAQDEARILKHDHIGTEHVLLGLLREEEGLAARVLKSLDVTVERVRAQVVRIVGGGEAVTVGQVPFSDAAKQVLELALREALSLGHNYIGTEHVLLGLVRANEGVATRVMLDLDADSETVRDEVIRMMSGPGYRQRATESMMAQPRGRPLEQIGLSDALLDGAGPPLRRLAEEFERRLGRPADAGDLLVLLALVPDGLAARTLAELGVAPDALVRVADEQRRAGARSVLLPPLDLLAECEKAREEKEAAIVAQQFERAAELRDRERELLERAHEHATRGHQELLAETWARLGLGEDQQQAPEPE